MKYLQTEWSVKELKYFIRQARLEDAEKLSHLRYQIDGETENMNREQGEDFLDSKSFEAIIQEDAKLANHLFLVAEADGQLIGYSRCAGSQLKRFQHQVEFGLGVRKVYWGYAVGRHLMTETIAWADGQHIEKIVLHGVLETNDRGIALYKKLGFEIEGFLKKDRKLSDGKYYGTYIMSRFLKGADTDVL